MKFTGAVFARILAMQRELREEREWCRVGSSVFRTFPGLLRQKVVPGPVSKL